MRYLHYLFWVLKFVLFIILFSFAMHNANPVTLHFFMGHAWNVSLAMLLLVFFVLGALFGLLACFARMARLRRELVSMRREIRSRGPVTRPTFPEVPKDAF